MPNSQRPKASEQPQQTALPRPPISAERKKALSDAAPTIPRYGPASTQSPPSSQPTTQRRDFIAEVSERPATGTQRLRAEPYVASRHIQQKQMRRFALGGADPFHGAAHKVDLVVRPTLAALTLLFNIIMQFVWAALQLSSAFLPENARRHMQHTRAPELRADHPLAAVLLFALLIWMIGGIAQPILWRNTGPREFDYTHRTWTPSKSDPLKAVDILRIAWNTLVPVTVPAAPAIQPALPVRPAGDHNVQGAASITVDQINQILASYNSPAAGTGQVWYDLGEKYQIDPAYAIAFFIHESSAGTATNWAGLKSDGGTTHNIGNIICAGYSTCYGRFRDYPTWEAGIEDWYRLISVEYIQGRGTVTVEQIVPIYAPSFENNVDGYVASVTQMVDGWRANGVR